MKKKAIILVFLFLIPFVIADTYSSSSINWLSKLHADTLYCKLLGNCEVNNLIVDGNLTVYGNTSYANVVTTNVTGDFNVSGNLNVGGNTTSSWFIGFINFSYIKNWDWSAVYLGIKSFISNDFYNKSQIEDINDSMRDFVIDLDTATNDSMRDYVDSQVLGGGGGTANSTPMTIYLDHSMTKDVNWNVSTSDTPSYSFAVIENTEIFPIGGNII